MRRFLILVVAGALAGGILGIFAPKAEAIVIHYSLRVHPAALNTMTCGWHDGGCPANPGGPAIDWDNGDYWTVYWRSYGWCSYGPCSRIARGTISLTVPYCTETRVAITDTYGRSQQQMIYTHTNTWQGGQQFDISGSTGYSWTQKGIGWSVTSDSCPFGGSHTHLKHSGSGWTRNTSKYPNAPATGYYPVTSFGYHQTVRGWYITF